MIMTIRPGPSTVTAGTATCASTLATATAVPGFRPVQAAASAEMPPARSPTGDTDVAAHLLVDDVGEARIERRKVAGVREAVALGPHGLVAGRAGVARLDAGEPPDHPVGGLDQPVRRRVDLRGLIQDLERLGEEPLGRDLAAVARQPGLAGLARDLVDAVRLRLRGVVLPELDPGVRVGAEFREVGEGSAVGLDRQHRAGREVDPQPDDVRRVHACRLQHGRHGDLEDAQVVLGILERPIRRQRNASARNWEGLVDHPVADTARRRSPAPCRSPRPRGARGQIPSRSPPRSRSGPTSCLPRLVTPQRRLNGPGARGTRVHLPSASPESDHPGFMLDVRYRSR